MARYIEETEIYKLVEPHGTAKVHCSQIDELPRADVVPKSEVEKIIEETFKRVRENFVISPLCKSALSDLEAELKKKYTEGKDKPAAEEKYFSPEDVRNMTQREVREKYTAIRKSMERW